MSLKRGQLERANGVKIPDAEITAAPAIIREALKRERIAKQSGLVIGTTAALTSDAAKPEGEPASVVSRK